MATSLTNLFNFSRPLPPPFDKLGSKKIEGVASQYGGTDATLCAAVIKAVNALCACYNGGAGAVGKITSAMSVAEYLSSPAVWYTAEGGITALDVMLRDLESELLSQ